MEVNDFATANTVMLEVFAAEATRLDDATKEAFIKVITSPIAPEASAHFVEFVYAHSAKFLKTSRAKAADVASFVTANGFYGFRDKQRGMKLGQSLLGETVEDKPEALPQFKTPDETVVTTPPEGNWT